MFNKLKILATVGSISSNKNSNQAKHIFMFDKIEPTEV